MTNPIFSLIDQDSRLGNSQFLKKKSGRQSSIPVGFTVLPGKMGYAEKTE